jgi:HAD superfamily hydrolase (TIGR01509 family)
LAKPLSAKHKKTHSLRQVLKGVIWDMDGVLIDSMEIHFAIWKEFFTPYQVAFTRRDFNRHFGTTNLQTILTTLGDRVNHREAIALSNQKQALFEQQAIQQVKLIPGVKNWLEKFQSMGIPQAVASSNTQGFIESVAGHLKINHFFKAMISAEGLESKPHPQVFLEAAKRIHADPSRCLVIEDAVAGVEGAKRAGMRCLAVTTTNPASALSGADLILNGFEQLHEELVINLFNY